MKSDKRYMYLVTDKRVVKYYDKFTVTLIDGAILEYNMSEYEASYIDNDWLEVRKKDDTVMEWFAMHNVLRIRFVSSKAKIVPNEKPTLQPVA
jgi:hypothetical protein